MYRQWIGSRAFTVLGVVALGGALLLGACTAATPVPTAPPAPTPAPTPTAVSPNNAVVTVTMDEWHLIPSIASVPAGKVTFIAVDRGAVDHEVVILRTDKAANAMVVKSDTGKVDEAASGENMGEVEVEAGATGASTFNLTPGHYALICNVVEPTAQHYKKGMYADFTVR